MGKIWYLLKFYFFVITFFTSHPLTSSLKLFTMSLSFAPLIACLSFSDALSWHHFPHYAVISSCAVFSKLCSILLSVFW